MKRGIYSYFLNQTIQQRFRFWIAVVIVVLGFSIIIPFYFTERHSRLTEVESQLQQIVALQSLYIEKWSQEKLDTIKRFANSDNAKRLQIAALIKEVEVYSRVHSEFDMFFFVDQEGYTLPGKDSNSKTYVGDRPYFEQAVKNKEHISGVMVNKVTGEPMITFSAPVHRESGEFLGAVVGTVSVDMLDTLMEQLSFGQTGEVFVLDTQGKVVTASRAQSKLEVNAMMTTDIVQRAKAKVASNESYIGFHGKKVYGQYKWSTGNRWIIIGEITEDEVFRNLHKISMTIIAITLIALILSFAAAIVITSRIERSIRYLIRGTKIIQSGNYDFQIDEDKIKLAPVELRQLCRTFNLMSSKLKDNIALLEHSALVDQLTQIHNRRYMMLEGGNRLQACIAAGQTCSVMMIDIDRFKKINDTYGHLIGDRVLHHVASQLKRHAAEYMIVARYGGEEFIILVPYHNVEECALQAENLRERIMEAPYADENIDIPITASIGVAEYSPIPEYGTNVLEDMVSRADHALYRAKSGGRNRVELDRSSVT
ncbi:sensor domain-containing diguanylate cyclase [Paenibacillus sedimenti]|uniref:Diguanylate cyclase n=1 Tax=Paenibacillus sedimenti TaxID=2770274 RepID=A0A926QM82_9BACL|nr:diguanylate cyclase [Paenibacillus sedimenti]MBD0383653.1 diguanylate cyclase [Paenibacillus sedimenti]